MSDFNATKYKNEFNKESYDRVSINFRKGQKAVKMCIRDRYYSYAHRYPHLSK